MLQIKLQNQNIAIGILTIIIGIISMKFSFAYDFGSLANIGPGFFPTLLSSVLIILGSTLLFTCSQPQTIDVQLKSFLLIIISLILFSITLLKLGLFAAVGLSVLTASLANNITAKIRLLLTVAIMLIMYVIFVVVLQFNSIPLGPTV